jgi:hypothetical protein
MTGEYDWLWWTLAGAVVALVLLGLWVWSRGRTFAAGDVFRASRISKGNRLFPTQVLITSSNVVQFTPSWIGKSEESIHISHVASVRIDTHVLFSDVLIETTGGAHPISCYGHRKRDAVQMKGLIERYQNEHYRQARPSAAAPVGQEPSSR